MDHSLDQQFKRWCEDHAATAWTRGTEWWQSTALNLYGDDNVRAAGDAGLKKGFQPISEALNSGDGSYRP